MSASTTSSSGTRVLADIDERQAARCRLRVRAIAASRPRRMRCSLAGRMRKLAGTRWVWGRPISGCHRPPTVVLSNGHRAKRGCVVATFEAGEARDSAQSDVRTAALQERIWRRSCCRSAQTRAQCEVGVCEGGRGFVVVRVCADGLPSNGTASLDRRQRRSTRRSTHRDGAIHGREGCRHGALSRLASPARRRAGQRCHGGWSE